MEVLEIVIKIISTLAGLVTIFTGSIAIYIYFSKGKEVKLLFSALINYSYQTTLHELKGKLDRLSEYSADSATDLPEVINIFHEIAGQIRGNSRLNAGVPELLKKVDDFIEKKSPRISEPRKRALVSEIREVIKNLNVDSIENYIEK
jgi:hypothetical protein